MKKFINGLNKQRIASASLGLLLANFVVAILVDQLGVPLHPNVIATGTLLLAALINKVVSKYFN